MRLVQRITREVHIKLVRYEEVGIEEVKEEKISDEATRNSQVLGINLYFWFESKVSKKPAVI